MGPQRLIILAILFYIAWRLVRNLIREKLTELQESQKAQEETKVQDILKEDPVCHLLIPEHEAVRLRQDGKTYYFCSDACCDTFIDRPGEKE